jgi:hypothetical protein
LKRFKPSRIRERLEWAFAAPVIVAFIVISVLESVMGGVPVELAGAAGCWVVDHGHKAPADCLLVRIHNVAWYAFIFYVVASIGIYAFRAVKRVHTFLVRRASRRG